MQKILACYINYKCPGGVAFYKGGTGVKERDYLDPIELLLKYL